MGRYEILFRRSVLKDLKPIPKKDVKRILATIESLADDPRPPQCRKLSSEEKYRLRCGVYRILYSIEDTKLVVCIVKVGHRKDVYRNTS
ncbi:MAG: type II toxin-antitoxin system RelE/ParE family toxin [Chloroflexi bacterium]|jgi:mRNA interferase RelE/StbE|nr:type II toxin-antitoxin system RelE/ParE family toxin [Chloroflexota bacterium]